MLQEKTYFDVVSVNDDLPEEYNPRVICVAKLPFNNEIAAEFTYWIQGDGRKSFTLNRREMPPTYENNVTHWLKEKQGILLSKNDLIELLEECFDAGSEFSEGTLMDFINKKFLK